MNLGRSGASCSECGADTPKKVYLCNPCINFDPYYSDYRTEEETWFEAQYYKDIEETMHQLDVWAEQEAFWGEDRYGDFLRKQEEVFWETMNAIEESISAYHGLTGN